MIAVDLDKVLLEVCKGCNEEFSEEPCEPGDCRVRQRLEELPHVTLDDLRPKGRWVDRECTNCGCDALYNKGVPVPTYTEFCPSCGADMRGYMSDGQRNQEG